MTTRRFQKFFFVAILLSPAVVASLASAQSWLSSGNAQCLADAKQTNGCSGLGDSCCAAQTPCTTYCSTYHSAANCSGLNGSTCYYQNNISCGTLNSCSSKAPVKDSNGQNVNCTGAPDICQNTKPIGPGGN